MKEKETEEISSVEENVLNENVEKENISDEKADNENVDNVKSKNIKIIALLIAIVIIIVLLFLLFRKVPQYSITFDSNGGSQIETITVKENDTIIKPENPTKEGYEFLGWYYNNKLFDFSQQITGDITLEARWGKSVKASGVKLDQTELVLHIGDTAKLIAIVEPENASNKKVIWESSNPEIVSVDANGNIKALKEGSVTITVTTKDGEFKAEAKITVEAAPINTDGTVVNVTGVSLNRTSLTLTVGQTSKLTATVKPTNATNKNVTWSSSNSNVVSVDANGNIKAKAAGTATIIVTTTDGKFTAKATITVNNANNNNNNNNNPEPDIPVTVNVTGVALNKTSLTLTEGNSERLTATVNPSNATNKNVTWSSSNPNVVSVDVNGNIRAVAAGSATITVTTQDGNHKATCQVTVNPKPDSYSVTLTPRIQPLIPVTQYNVIVKKNGSTFNEWEGIMFNNGVPFAKGNGTISSGRYEGISSATITLSDGTRVTATVEK